MSDSARIAGVIGPLLIALTATENPLVNPNLYDVQIPSVVYLSGALIFFGGFCVIRAHNHWHRDWTTVVTVVGWTAVALGLTRMTFPHAYIESAGGNNLPVVLVEILLFLVGVLLTYKAYFDKAVGRPDED